MHHFDLPSVKIVSLRVNKIASKWVIYLFGNKYEVQKYLVCKLTFLDGRSVNPTRGGLLRYEISAGALSAQLGLCSLGALFETCKFG